MTGEAEERHLSVGIVVQACTLGLIGLVMSLAFLIFNLRLRNNRMIKMTSPNLNLVLAGGGILLSACCALHGMDYFFTNSSASASAVCRVRAGLLACGFSMLYGPLLAKAWRVYMLFRDAGTRRVIIRDSQLLMVTAVLVIVDIVLVVIWQSTGPLTYQFQLVFTQIGSVIDPDSLTSELQPVRIMGCTGDNAHSWLAGFLLLKMALLAYGLFLSWRTRAVALPSMNDSRCIVVSTMTTITMATFAVSVSYLLHEQPNAVYACVVLSIWLCSTVATCMAFVPKMALWWRNPEGKGIRLSVPSSTCSACSVAGLHLHPSHQVQEELSQVAAENEVLRKSLEERDSSIRELQHHLTSAQTKLSQLGLTLDKQDSGLDADLSSSDCEDGGAVRKAVTGVSIGIGDTPPQGLWKGLQRSPYHNSCGRVSPMPEDSDASPQRTNSSGCVSPQHTISSGGLFPEQAYGDARSDADYDDSSCSERPLQSKKMAVQGNRAVTHPEGSYTPADISSLSPSQLYPASSAAKHHQENQNEEHLPTYNTSVDADISRSNSGHTESNYYSCLYSGASRRNSGNSHAGGRRDSSNAGGRRDSSYAGGRRNSSYAGGRRDSSFTEYYYFSRRESQLTDYGFIDTQRRDSGYTEQSYSAASRPNSNSRDSHRTKRSRRGSRQTTETTSGTKERPSSKDGDVQTSTRRGGVTKVETTKSAHSSRHSCLPRRRESDTAVVYRRTSRSDTAGSNRSVKRRRHQRRRHSATSVASLDNLASIRDSITQDLKHARSLSNLLGDSLSKDIVNATRRSRACHVRRRSGSGMWNDDLTESIVSSYGLEDTSDAHSFVSSFLPPCISQQADTGHTDASGNFSVLASDCFYPKTNATLNPDTNNYPSCMYPEKRRRDHVINMRFPSVTSRPVRQKSDCSGGVYTIQLAGNPEFHHSGYAQTRVLCFSDTFI